MSKSEKQRVIENGALCVCEMTTHYAPYQLNSCIEQVFAIVIAYYGRDGSARTFPLDGLRHRDGNQTYQVLIDGTIKFAHTKPRPGQLRLIGKVVDPVRRLQIT